MQVEIYLGKESHFSRQINMNCLRDTNRDFMNRGKRLAIESFSEESSPT